MNFKFQKNVAIVLSSVIIGTTALSGVHVYADEITATEEDVSLNDDIFNENDIIYGISTQSSDAETTLTKSEMSAFAQAFRIAFSNALAPICLSFFNIALAAIFAAFDFTPLP